MDLQFFSLSGRVGLMAGSIRRVGVVVVDYNGRQLTLDCLAALAATTWFGEIETVLVDNASKHTVVAEVAARWPDVRIVSARSNLGFAGGCNLGIAALGAVDAVALINNDAVVEPGWLAPLVDALEADESLGAACPRIVFGSKFATIDLDVPTRRRSAIDRRQVGAQLRGVELRHANVPVEQPQYVDGFWGWQQGARGTPRYQWTKARARLRVPLPPAQRATCVLRLSALEPLPVVVSTGGSTRKVTVGPATSEIVVEIEGPADTIVNNAGTELRNDWYGVDRGYQEPDNGRFAEPADVTAWSGGGVLLRRSYLSSCGDLDERLFLYYEDLELALRGAARGWRYRYVPASVIGHRHSASSVDGSDLAEYYKERNRLLVMTRHAPIHLLATAVVRFLLATGSYARRDIVAPLARGERPELAIVRRRLRSLGGWLRVAPSMLKTRRDDRRRSRARERNTSEDIG